MSSATILPMGWVAGGGSGRGVGIGNSPGASHGLLVHAPHLGPYLIDMIANLDLASSCDSGCLEWRVSPAPVAYPDAVSAMEHRVDAIRRGSAGELVWLLEHPPVYTAGTSARPEDLLEPDRFPVFHSGRGGRYTYHGPGQRVVYVMLDLNRRNRDVRAYVNALEQWIIDSLAQLGIRGERRDGRIGIWVAGADGSVAKVAAIGVRVRRWVTFHGIAINVAPDLSHFSAIVPCGISDWGVTSLRALGAEPSLAHLDAILRHTFFMVFGHAH